MYVHNALSCWKTKDKINNDIDEMIKKIYTVLLITRLYIDVRSNEVDKEYKRNVAKKTIWQAVIYIISYEFRTIDFADERTKKNI